MTQQSPRAEFETLVKALLPSRYPDDIERYGVRLLTFVLKYADEIARALPDTWRIPTRTEIDDDES